MKVPSVASSVLLGASLLILLVTGCVHTPQGYVAKEWSSSMRELGIVPVFPPREDVQVGDVFIAPVSPDAEVEVFKAKGFLPLGLWLAHLDVTSELTSFYTGRASFPPTSAAIAGFMDQLSSSPFACLPQAQVTNASLFAGRDLSRLRMVGFPTFMSATFNKGDLAAVVPVEAVNLAFAGGFTTARSVTVSVPVAESYGLPADAIWSKVMNAQGGLINFSNIPRDQLHNLVNPKQVVKQGTNYYAPLRVINEVYYTRVLDVSVAAQTARGFGVSGQPIATAAAGAGAAALVSGAKGVTNSGSANTGPVYIAPGVTNSNGNAVERAAELNESLSGALAQTIPGGSLRFVAAGDRGVSLRRTYDRPIAIGYRALQLLVPLEHAPVGGSASSAWTPTSSGPSYVSPVPPPVGRGGDKPSGEGGQPPIHDLPPAAPVHPSATNAPPGGASGH